MPKNRVKSILEELRKEQPLYASYLAATKQILESLLARHEFNAQVILVRIKKEDSLVRNLRTKEKKAEKLSDINDVAGCRVIFYYDYDSTRFFNYLEEEFLVSNPKKFTSYDLGKDEKGYNALHAVIRLNDARLQLVEYQDFKDIPCEIQITTAIYHAWQEVTHDILYKDNDQIQKNDPRGYSAVREEFREALHSAVETQRSLDHAIKNVEQIKKNKEFFNSDYLTDIRSASDNNYLHDALETLKNALKSSGDKFPENFDVADFVLRVLTKAKEYSVVDINTTFGSLPGKKYVDVLDEALGILDLYKYKYPRQIALALNQLYSTVSDSDEIKRIDASVSSLVKYDYNAKDNALNYGPQREVLDFILSRQEFKGKADTVLHVSWARKILHPSYEATQMSDYNTVSWHFGGLFVNDFLRKLRNDAITYLFKAYKSSKNITHKIDIIDALNDAVTRPVNADVSKELDTLLATNARDIVSFYKSILDSATEPVIDKIYSNVWWLKDRTDTPEMVDKLKEAILLNKKYAFYKLCVGYNDHDPDSDLQEINKVRDEQLKTIVEQIRLGKPGYKQAIIRIAKYYPYIQDHGRFYRFGALLSDIAVSAPDFLEPIFLEKQSLFKPFIENILQGLWYGDRKVEVRAMAKNWIKKNQNLAVLANWFNHIGEIDFDLAQAIFHKSKTVNDIRPQFYLIQAIAKYYKKDKKIKALFIDLLQQMKKQKNTEWLKWLRHADAPIFRDLSIKQWQQVMELLVEQESVDLGVEEILKTLFEVKQEKGLIIALEFFDKRIAKALVNKKNSYSPYSPVPFDLYYIAPLFAEYAELTVNNLLSWFSKDGLKNFFVADLISSIFPSFHPALEKSLLEIISQGSGNATAIALAIASKYEGQTFLHKILRMVVIKNSKNDEVGVEVMHALSSTGVVSGEYGFVHAYEKKKKEVVAWKKDKNKSVVNFYKKYISYLDRRIKEEQKRADEDIAFRKRDFKY